MTNDIRFQRPARGALGLLGLLGLLGACGLACSGGGGTVGAGSGTEPLYAMMVQVYDGDERTVFLALSSSLDEPAAIDDARQFAGVANFAAVNGRVLVSDGAAPKIMEFEIDDAHRWKDTGRSVDFGQYPLEDNANFYYQFLVDEHTALLPFEATKRIVWDPAEMKIKGTLEDTTLVGKEAGLTLDAGGNRNSVHYDGSVMQAFFYHDEDWTTYGTQSHVIVYDAVTQKEKSVLDIPCPGMSLATRDEQGNTYFATWDLPTSSLLGKAPATCIAKVSAQGQLVETIDPRQWTEGRFINNFRYVGNGKAVANVLHHEELGVAKPADLTAEMAGDIWMSGPHWRLWLFDVAAKTGHPVEGIDVALGSGAQFAVLDGRTFVFVPYDDWGRTKIYEIDADGKATPHFDTVGDVFKWVRVR